MGLEMISKIARFLEYNDYIIIFQYNTMQSIKFKMYLVDYVGQ